MEEIIKPTRQEVEKWWDSFKYNAQDKMDLEYFEKTGRNLVNLENVTEWYIMYHEKNRLIK